MSLDLALLGFFVSVLVGLTGVGGAALLTPLLVLIGINPTIAVGSDLVYNSVTKLFGTIQHARQKTINWALVKYLAFGSIPGAAIAVLFLELYRPLYTNQEKVIRTVLGIVLIIVAIATIFHTLLINQNTASRLQSKGISEKRSMMIIVGVVLGFIVGLTSIGSGSLFALAMLLLFRLKASELVGTDIAHAFILVTVSGALHTSFGNVDFMLVLNMILGSIPGVIIGSKLSSKVPTKILRVIISIIILISGYKLL